jgi:HAD superfamily hydrolase (TIGR01509 family)
MKGESMDVASAAWAAIVSAVITAVGVVAANLHWRRDFDARLQQVHEEVTKQLIGLRTEPYMKFMHQLEPMSRRRASELVTNRGRALEFAEVFQGAIYGPVGVLASNDTREIIVASRAGCLQYAEMKLPLDRMINRIWAIHQALRSDLGIEQPNWPNEIERRRLRQLAGDADAIDAIVESAVHIGYGLYSDWYRLRSLGANRSFAAIILDMDGLMLDTEVLERRAWQRAAHDFGFAITDEEFLSLIGRTEDDTRKILADLWEMPPEDVAKFGEIRARKISYADQEEIAIKEGLPDLLAWARMERIPTAVASSSPREKIFSRLNSAGIINDVDVIVGGDEVKQGKPAPDIFVLAANRLGSKTKACVVLEDSDSGIAGASRAGMTPILVPDRSVAREIPAQVQSQAFAILDSLSEVLILLKAGRPISQPYHAEGSRFWSPWTNLRRKPGM